MAGLGVSPRNFEHLPAGEVRVGDAEAVVATEFSFILPIPWWPRQVGHTCQSAPTRALKSPSKYMASEFGIPNNMSPRDS